jgi:hypothetical protein
VPEAIIDVNGPLEPGELYRFYQRNDICEAQYGQEISERVLAHPSIYVTARIDNELIGFARALFDGLTADIMEFCLDLRYQNANTFENGCFIQSDPHGIARRMGLALFKELRRRGCHFFSALVYGIENDGELDFYRSFGFRENVGHKNLTVDARPYVPGGDERGRQLDALEE